VLLFLASVPWVSSLCVDGEGEGLEVIYQEAAPYLNTRDGFSDWPRFPCFVDVLPLGKSSLTIQFVEGHFVESYYPTIENTFTKVIRHKGQEFTAEIIDTAGQVVGWMKGFEFKGACANTSRLPLS
jgi:hypothetical protein